LFVPVRFDDPAVSRASRRRRAPWAIALAGCVGAGASGCVQEPLPCLVKLEEGDVVITEIRGPQDGRDTRGEWFELHNATDERLDLYGLRGFLRPLEGSAVDGELALTFLVRESLPVEPGGSVVLGTLPFDALKRPEVDYSVNLDFVLESSVVDYETNTGDIIQIVPPAGVNVDPKELFANAQLALFACDRLIDDLRYVQLPSCGTLAYDGSLAPSGDDNDDLSHWCADATAPEWCTGEADDTLPVPWGAPGSGGEANRPCP
jgi:hypothetical protein